MTARRRLLAASSATFALAALTACEKPAPIVTVVSGGESVYTEASVFCFDEEASIEAGSCAQRADEPKRLSVRPGETVGVDVGKELTERGWQLSFTNPANPQDDQASTTFDDHYFTFTAPGIEPGGRRLLTVRTVRPEGDGLVSTGQWEFELVPRD